MEDKLLSICIPTHHGRAEFLLILLESIARQLQGEMLDKVEICISENGSTDCTIEFVNYFKSKYPAVACSYFRFLKNEGLRNFEKVFSMA